MPREFQALVQQVKACTLCAPQLPLGPRPVFQCHPSPRNNRWLQRNAWFEVEVIPLLQARVAALLAG